MCSWRFVISVLIQQSEVHTYIKKNSYIHYVASACVHITYVHTIHTQIKKVFDVFMEVCHQCAYHSARGSYIKKDSYNYIHYDTYVHTYIHTYTDTERFIGVHT
jgi:hypothetical protein